MQQRATGPVILLALAFVGSQAHLGHLLAPLSPNFICVQLTFDSQAFWRAIAAWGPEGMARLQASLLPWDLMHPVIYGLFGYLLATRTNYFHAWPHWRRGLAWALPIAALCDLVENACELYLLSIPLGTPSIIIPVSAGFSLVKWTIAAGFVVMLLVALASRFSKMHLR